MAYNLNPTLVSLTGMISKDFYREKIRFSKWLSLIPRGTWEDEVGYSYSALLFNRSFPTANPTWTRMAAPTGSGSGTCTPTQLELTTGSTTRSIGLDIIDVKSEAFCSQLMRFNYEIKKQLSNIVEGFKDNMKFVLESKYQDDYTNTTENKRIANSTFSAGTSSFPLTVPTSPVTFGMLNVVRQELIIAGAGEGSFGMENGGPVFMALGSMASIENILHNNPDIVADLHFSSKADDNIRALGVDRSYRGWYFAAIDYPARWDFADGAWVRRWPWAVDSLATFGVSTSVATAYNDADYEDFYIIPNKRVMEELVPKPISSFGSGTVWKPETFVADVNWKVILDEATNPYGRIGRYWGSLALAAAPIQPRFGYVIRAKRCGLDLGLSTCPTYSYP